MKHLFKMMNVPMLETYRGRSVIICGDVPEKAVQVVNRAKSYLPKFVYIEEVSNPFNSKEKYFRFTEVANKEETDPDGYVYFIGEDLVDVAQYDGVEDFRIKIYDNPNVKVVVKGAFVRGFRSEEALIIVSKNVERYTPIGEIEYLGHLYRYPKCYLIIKANGEIEAVPENSPSLAEPEN